MLKMQKYTFLEYYGCCFGEKKLLLQASSGMSSLWGQEGKGMGSMSDEAVHIKLLSIKPPPIDSLLSHLPAQE